MPRKSYGLGAILLGAVLLLMAGLAYHGRTREKIAPPPSYSSAPPRKTFLKDPFLLQQVETDTEALPLWREFAPVRPTLLLLSDELVRYPVPETLWPRAAELISRGTQEEITRLGSGHTPDPLLIGGMAVDAALRSRWFGGVVWVLPLREADKPLMADDLRRKLLDGGFITPAEAKTFAIRDGRITGTLRGVPMVAAPLPHLPPLKGPVIVHIDQSYFQRLYRNEVATPLFPLLEGTLRTMRDLGISTSAATFCRGNLESGIPLDVRFVGEFLAERVQAPEILDRPLQPLWGKHRQGIYLANFFQKERIREINLAIEKDAPASAWAKFALFRSAADRREGTAALRYLAEAVALDRLYALEYLDLAEMAYEKKRPEEARRMLLLAAKALPEIPLIRLQIAQLSIELGDTLDVLDGVNALQKLPWSPVYHPDVPDSLSRLSSTLQDPSRLP